MTNRFKENKGFTLVELIVVIAIIAILAAVSIVGFSSYIDNARFSNDTQAARSMTTIIENHTLLNSTDIEDAHTARLIINEYNDGEFDFTPSSKNTGYFYLESTGEVVALRYEDAEGYVSQLHYHNETILLSDDGFRIDAANSYGSSPEELFGIGSHLMTTSGSPVAEVVNLLSNIYPNIGNFAAAQAQFEELKAQADGFLGSLLGLGLPSNVQTLVDDMYDYYHPDHTLFVSNSGWTSVATGNIQRILIGGGVTNIPSYTLEGFVLTGVTSISIPSRIRSIETDSFSEFTELTAVSGLSSNVLVANGAFDDTVKTALSISETDILLHIVDISSMVSITNVNTDDIAIDFDVLKQNLRTSGLTLSGFKLTVNSATQQELFIYTLENGLYGSATLSLQLKSVTFISNFDRTFGSGITAQITPAAQNVFYVFETTNPSLTGSLMAQAGAPIPVHPQGKTFGGWFLGSVNQAGNVTLIGESAWDFTQIFSDDLTLYAKWND